MDMEQKNNPLKELLGSTMEKVREMADTNTIVGQPITTPDGVTLIPVSRVSFGFGSGAGVKIDPVAFLVIKDGSTRVLPVAVPPVSTVERIVDMAPDLMERVEKLFDKKAKQENE